MNLFLYISMCLCIRLNFNEHNEYIFDETQLPIIIIDHRSKYLVVSLSLEIGSIDDPKGYSGCIHLLEHIICSPESTFYKFIIERGGKVEATTKDRMLYIEFQVLDDFYIKSIKLFFQNLIDLKFTEDIIKEEIDQINEEFFYRKQRFSAIANFYGEIEKENIFICGNKETLSKEDINFKLLQKYKESIAGEISVVVLTPLSVRKKKNSCSNNINAFELDKDKARKIINLIKKYTTILRNKWDRKNSSRCETSSESLNDLLDLCCIEGKSFSDPLCSDKNQNKQSNFMKYKGTCEKRSLVKKLGLQEHFKINKSLFLINSSGIAIHIDVKIPLILNSIILEIIMFLYEDELKMVYGNSLEHIKWYYSYEFNDIYVHFTLIFKHSLHNIVYLVIRTIQDIILKKKDSLIYHIKKKFTSSHDIDPNNFKVVHNLIKFFNSDKYTLDDKNNNTIDCIRILKAFADINNYSSMYECKIEDFKTTKHYEIEYKIIDNYLEKWMHKSFDKTKKEIEYFLDNIETRYPKLNEGSLYGKRYENFEINLVVSDNDVILLQIFTEPVLEDYISLCILFEYINLFLRNRIRILTKHSCEITAICSSNKIDIKIKGKSSYNDEILYNFLSEFKNFIIKCDSKKLRCKMVRNLIFDITKKYRSIPFITKEIYGCDDNTLYKKLLEIIVANKEEDTMFLIDESIPMEDYDDENFSNTQFLRKVLGNCLTIDDLSNVSNEDELDPIKTERASQDGTKEFKNILELIPVYLKANFFTLTVEKSIDKFKYYSSVFPFKTNRQYVEIVDNCIFLSNYKDVFNTIFCYLDLKVIKSIFQEPMYAYFINYCSTYFLYKHSDYLKKVNNLGYCVVVTFNLYDFRIEVNTCKDFLETNLIFANYIDYAISKIKESNNLKEVLYKIFEFTSNDIYDFYYHYNFNHNIKTFNNEYKKFLEREDLFSNIIKTLRTSFNVFYVSEDI